MLTFIIVTLKTWVYTFAIPLALPTYILTHGHQLASATQIVCVLRLKKKQEEERGFQLIPILFIKKVNGFQKFLQHTFLKIPLE